MESLFKFGDGGRLLQRLKSGPTEIYFAGASVTAQRDGWADKLLQLARTHTGHAHTATLNAMGGVGLLFGVANHANFPLGDLPRVAFVEFSTGDLNLGLTPLAQLGPWLTELLIGLAAQGTPVVLVHNWRADFDADDRAGIRRLHDEVAQKLGVPVIENHRMVDAALAAGSAVREAWFRDVCHTLPPGALAYAEHVWACLVGMSNQPAPPGPALPASPTHPIVANAFCGTLPPATGVLSEFVYVSTRQRFPVLTLACEDTLSVRASGLLAGVAMISGPRACWVRLLINGQQVRRFRVFDRNSHYERYVLLPAVFELDGSLLQLQCDDEAVDFGMASQAHADFAQSRQLKFVHWVGSGLRLRDLNAAGTAS